MDAEILQATVDKDSQPTCLIAEAGALNRQVLLLAMAGKMLVAAHGHQAQLIKFLIILAGNAFLQKNLPELQDDISSWTAQNLLLCSGQDQAVA